MFEAFRYNLCARWIAFNTFGLYLIWPYWYSKRLENMANVLARNIAGKWTWSELVQLHSGALSRFIGAVPCTSARVLSDGWHLNPSLLFWLALCGYTIIELAPTFSQARVLAGKVGLAKPLYRNLVACGRRNIIDVRDYGSQYLSICVQPCCQGCYCSHPDAGGLASFISTIGGYIAVVPTGLFAVQNLRGLRSFLNLTMSTWCS